MDALPVGENCVKLKNLLCGVTPTDLAVFEGKLEVQCPIIPLRQCVGFVSEVGESVRGIQRGQRVVTYPQASCHNCKACKDSRYYDCEKPEIFGVKEDGFLSDFSVVSADDVYTIPDRITDEEAIFIEHIATGLNALSRLHVEKGDQLVIMGATVDGIILAQLAMYYQAVPIMVDMNDDLLRLAQRLGVYFTVNVVNEDACKKILSLTGGHKASACAFLTQSNMPLQSVCDYTARGGRVAIVGRIGQNELTCRINDLLERNIDLYTVVDCGKNYSTAINLIANRTVTLTGLIEHTFAFDKVQDTLESMTSSPAEYSLKTVIKI